MASPHELQYPSHALPPPPPPDFPNFGFDSSFPPPPPVPSSADLFSSAETNDLFGFLDSFGGHGLDMPFPDSAGSFGMNDGFPAYQSPPMPSAGHFDAPAPPEGGFGSSSAPGLLGNPFEMSLGSFSAPHSNNMYSQPPPAPTYAPMSTTAPASARAPSKRKAPSAASRSGSPEADMKDKKALLSSPQKRLNHILSEQKRRNAIRDGYAALTTLLAPRGAPPGSGMPTRGRPKGSGARGKGKTKGKSGVLFRAVEYVRWLEEGLSELEREVARVEGVAAMA